MKISKKNGERKECLVENHLGVKNSNDSKIRSTVRIGWKSGREGNSKCVVTIITTTLLWIPCLCHLSGDN